MYTVLPARVLVPGGRLVLADLNRWSVWATWRRARGRLGSSIWRAARFRSVGELARLARIAGFEVERTAGAIYYPPIGLAARLLAPLDRALGTVTTLGPLSSRSPQGRLVRGNQLPERPAHLCA